MEHPRTEKTFVLLKPDAVQRSLVGEIIHRIERTGLKLVALKIMIPKREQAMEHYFKDDVWCTEKSLLTAQFYEKQGRYKAAIIYYQDVIDTYPESSFVGLAKSKIESLTAKLERSRTRSTPFAFMNKPTAKNAETPKNPEETKAKAAWHPFNFSKPAKPKEAETVAEAPKAKGWAPLNFTKPAKANETAVQAAPEQPEQKVSKAKGWTPLNFNKPAKPKEEPVVSGSPKKSSGWGIFGFGKPSKPKEVETGVEAPKTRGWTPLNFTKTGKTSSETKVAEVKKEEQAVVVPAPAPETPPETVPEAKGVEPEKPIVNDAGAVTKTETTPPKEDAVVTAMSQAQAVSQNTEAETKTDDNPDDQIEKDEH